MVVTVMNDPAAEAAAFEPVAVTVEEVVPRIEVSVPGMLFAPVTGAVPYYGSEAALVERVAKEIEVIGGSGWRIGVAAGPFAAQRAAELATEEEPMFVVEDDRAFLASLDIANLGKEELAETFRWLGITTLGELAQLPREAIVSRFGSEGLSAHRLSVGEDRTPQPRVIPEDIAVEERFSPPLENLEQAAFVARAMAHRLISALASSGAAPHRVEVVAKAANGTERVRVWRNADPFDEGTLAERVRWQLRAWLDAARVGRASGMGGGLVQLRIAPADLSSAGRQLALHEDAHSAAEAERALVQTQALVGLDGLLQAVPQGGRDPGEQVAWYRWGEEVSTPQRDPAAPWPGRLPAPSPALVPPEPQLLEVEWDGGMPTRVRLGARWVDVLSWAGPWRKVGRWWEGEGPVDRYQLVTSAGAFLCEVREGRTYMTGVYD